MKISPHAQGTQEWKDARLGIPTSSQFHRIITAKHLKLSEQRHKYRAELLSEWLTGLPHDGGVSGPYLDRGTELEPMARDWFAVEYDTDPVEVGLCTTDDGSIGGSPDALIGDDGCMEIKCTNAAKHIGYLLDGPGRDHILQIQGHLWVCERSYSWFLAFNPLIAPRAIRFERDAAVQDALSEALPAFCAALEESKVRLRDLGCVPACERGTVSFAEAAGITVPPSIEQMTAVIPEQGF